MRAWMIGLALAAVVPSLAAAEEPPIVVRGEAARVEIQRILKADNLDTELLDSRTIADALVQIERGRAPEDFWIAYSAHVRAWNDLAEAEEGAQRVADQDAGSIDYQLIAIAQAETRIEKTFDEVERIALSYGARMPVPPALLRQIS